MAFGEALREAREEIRQSAKEVADKLQTPVRVIEALEREDFLRLPPRVYARAFLRKYSEYLGFSGEEILKEFDLAKQEAVPDEVRVNSRAKSERLFKMFSRRVGAASFSIIIVVLAIVVYFSYALRHVWGGPELVIIKPAENFVIDQERVRVSGSVEEGADVFLNGRALAVGEDGVFGEDALLHKGLNMLEFEAIDRLGKTRKVVRYIYVK